MRFTIVKKGIVLVAIPFVFHILFMLLLSHALRGQRTTHAQLAQAEAVISKANLLLEALLNAETGIRGFALTSEPSFSEPLEDALRQAPQISKDLGQLLRSNPTEEARAQDLGAATARFLAWHDDNRQLILRGEGAQAVERLRTGVGKAQMDKLRHMIAMLIESQERSEQEGRHALEGHHATLSWWLIGGSTTALILTIALSVWFTRGIGLRLRLLADKAQRLGAGEPPGPPLSGSDEVAQVDQVFRAMSAELARSLESLRGQQALLHQLNEELEERVLERTDELREANRELAGKNEENEMFVYSVSHDLRSPLVNLEGFSKELALAAKDVRVALLDIPLEDGVRKRLLGLVECDMAQSIHFIQTAVRRLSGIIDALLRLSRAGRIEYQMRQLDLNALMNRVATAVKSTMADRSASVDVRPLPRVWGDPVAIEQVFGNLVDNALKFLDPHRPGSIEIGESHQEGSPSPGSGAEGAAGGHAWRTIYVRDNGLGIAEAHQAKIFLAFRRAHPEAAPGEGMGLAIVRRIVERHRGKIWVESAAGAGSTFFVTLPDAGAPGNAAPAGSGHKNNAAVGEATFGEANLGEATLGGRTTGA